MPTHAFRPLVLAAALFTAFAPSPAPAQPRPAVTGVPSGPGGSDPALFRSPQLDPLTLVMGYHRLTGTTIDFRPYAEQGTAYRNATTFDRPEVLTREIARLEGQFTSLDLGRTYVMRLGTPLRQYDPARGGYPLGLNPEVFVPISDPVTYKGYGLQFRNADEVGLLPMGDTTAARNFAQKHALNMQYENAGDVVAELVFRLVEAPPGVGGGVTIVRADVVAARVLTRTGQLMWDFGSAAAARGPAPQAGSPGTVPALKIADVQGVRVGMPLAEAAGIASRAYPTQRYSDSRGGRWFRVISPAAEARATGMQADTAIRCGLDPLSLNDEMVRRQMGESTEVTVADVSEACLGFDGADTSSAVPIGQVARVTSGQRLLGATIDAVRQALTEKYGPVTYSRDNGRLLQWIGRDPARSDRGQVSLTARIEQRREGGVALGVEVVPYFDPNPQRAPTPASAPTAPRL